jgi:hypothetical protein
MGHSSVSNGVLKIRCKDPTNLPLGFGVSLGAPSFGLRVPYWCLMSIVFMVGAAPWMRQLRWRFSLRTLLISITLLALALGLIIATSR